VLRHLRSRTATLEQRCSRTRAARPPHLKGLRGVLELKKAATMSGYKLEKTEKVKLVNATLLY
jgi:hypothetical protein